MDKLELFPLPYKHDELAPVMSEETLVYHYDTLARAYVDNFNNGEGDSYFNVSGAALHNIFFQQFKAPEEDNQRSEEHTSELQSLRHLVCRLLLEKKKSNQVRKVLPSPSEYVSLKINTLFECHARCRVRAL